jgi:hypothetical protein
MTKVTFQSKPYKKTAKGPMIQSEIVEFYENISEDQIRLRALALGWTVLKVESV